MSMLLLPHGAVSLNAFNLQRFAIQPADGLASFDVPANTLREDISPILSALLMNDPRLVGMIATGDDTDRTEFSWLDDKMNPHIVTLSAAIDNVVVSMTLNAGLGKHIRIGTLLKDKAAGKTEVIQVTDAVGDVLTIVRGYGSTNAEAHAAGAEFMMVGKPLQENSIATAFVASQRARNSNFTQIFERTINLSRNTIDQGALAIDNEFNHQLNQKSIELTREFNLSLIYGIKSATAGSDTELRTTGGILEYLRQAGANYSNVAAVFTAAFINDMVNDCWKDGAAPTDIILNSALNRKLQSFDADKIRTDRSDRGVGRFITFFRNDVDGRELPITVDDDWPVDAVGLLDRSRIKRRPFVNANYISWPVNTGQDGQTHRVLSEWGLELRNALEAHALRENVSA